MTDPTTRFEIPEELPVLPLRELVVFPYMVLPIFVARERSIAAAKAKLLTPVGLRTLPQDDPEYHPRYEGDAFTRDGAYHRGIVWPWLVGPYAEAVLRAGDFGDNAQREARAAIATLLERLTTARHPGMLGQFHEIHEPEPPFAPRGCPAQAWSVAEVLRVWCMLNQNEGR